MLTFDFDMTLRAVVEAMLPRFSSWERGLVVTIDLRTSWYDDKRESMDWVDSRVIHFLFVRPNNYTKVIWASNRTFDGRSWSGIRPEDWRMSSDHDSCWCSDGFRPAREILHEMWKEVPKAFKPEDRCNIEGIQYVNVELEKYDDDRFPGSNRFWRPKSISAIDNEPSVK